MESSRQAMTNAADSTDLAGAPGRAPAEAAAGAGRTNTGKADLNVGNIGSVGNAAEVSAH